MSSKKRWKIREYRLQKDEDFYHQFCTTNQFPQLEFCVIPNKPHGTHRSGKTYHMRFYPIIGHITREIRCIPCACTQFTCTLYKPCTPGLSPHQQPCYKTDKDFTYWPVLISFNNCNTIDFSHKSTSSEDIEKINQFVLDGISDNMDALLQTVQYGNINTSDTTTMGYYVVKLLSEAYTLQEDTTCDVKTSTAG